MIIQEIKNVYDLDKIIRNQIHDNLELDKNKIINGLSVRGPELIKHVNENVYSSTDLSDTIIVFERSIDSSEKTISMEEIDNSITTYSHFQYKITIYGNVSDFVAYKLFSRLLSSEIRENLISKGIYIRDISNPQSINEFINNTIILRTDLEIALSCRFNFSKIISNEEFKKENLTIKNINILKEE